MEEPLAGGFNTCTFRARGGVNVIERAPHPQSASTIEAARREAQLTKLMSDLEIAPSSCRPASTSTDACGQPS